MFKIAIISGSRADYSLLYPVIKRFLGDATVETQLVATGCETANAQSLSEIFLQDGFTSVTTISSGFSDGSYDSVCQAIAKTVLGFSQWFMKNKPHLAIVLGDRYEIFAAVQTAWVYRIPVAHIAGGDVTAGAIDEAFRHSISKMSTLHFTTNEEARQRVLQLGEAFDRVHLVGSPGIDNLLNSPRLDLHELSRFIGHPSLPEYEKIFLITLHPETASALSVARQVECLISALDTLEQDNMIIITAANSDPGGDEINRRLREFVAMHDNAVFVDNLGRVAYVSLLSFASAMIGNSSSGIYEAASFKLPVVNIGDRQSGRLLPKNVINCGFDTQAIIDAIRQCDVLECQSCENPFGDGNSAKKIHSITMAYLDSQQAKEQRKYFQSYRQGEAT